MNLISRITSANDKPRKNGANNQRDANNSRSAISSSFFGKGFCAMPFDAPAGYELLAAAVMASAQTFVILGGARGDKARCCASCFIRGCCEIQGLCFPGRRPSKGRGCDPGSRFVKRTMSRFQLMERGPGSTCHAAHATSSGEMQRRERRSRSGGGASALRLGELSGPAIVGAAQQSGATGRDL